MGKKKKADEELVVIPDDELEAVVVEEPEPEPEPLFPDAKDVVSTRRDRSRNVMVVTLANGDIEEYPLEKCGEFLEHLKFELKAKSALEKRLAGSLDQEMFEDLAIASALKFVEITTGQKFTRKVNILSVKAEGIYASVVLNNGQKLRFLKHELASAKKSKGYAVPR